MTRTGLGLAAGLLAVLSAGAAAGQEVSGRILPVRPFVEQTAHGQALNFDVALENRGGQAVELTELEVTFVGADGGDILTRRLDGNGSAPSILTLPERTVEPGGERLLFNPFEYAPPGEAVASVRVRATLGVEEGIDLRMVQAQPPEVLLGQQQHQAVLDRGDVEP